MKNSIEDLRNHLFETIESLKDEENPMDIERAKTIADVGQTIINSAKVEVDFLRHTGRDTATPFLTNDKPKLPSYQGAQQGEQ